MSGIFEQFLIPVLLAGFALMLFVHAQDQTGFISIDCGLEENSTYSEKTTTISYISDAAFIDTGERKSVLPEYKNNYQQPYWSLRSFPKGTRNCYQINVKSGTKYLIRAGFFYGNYDGENRLPEFELHLGPNLWDLVSLEDASTTINKELIHCVSAQKDYLHVCLVKTGSDIPFISTIELRPLPNNTYQTQTGSLALYTRFDTGQITANRTGYRYPFDMHDRFWYGYSREDWAQLSTSSTIDLKPVQLYRPGSVIMRTAASPTLETDDLSFNWLPDDKNAEYYVYMHFAEVEELQANQSRQLEITRNGELYVDAFTPDYLETKTVWNDQAMSGGQYNFTVRKGAGNSGLPPILNAYEIYTVKEFSEEQTNQDDVNGITKLKVAYKIEKNWQGDPCLPKNYSWQGLNCSYSPNDSPRIIYLDLSSSGLTAEIDASIRDLTMIQTLDLSNNNLTGAIPDFLSQMSNLNVLNLENNKLRGSVPIKLTEKVKNGLLSLSLCNNPNLSGNVFCKIKKKKQSFVIPIVGSIIGISVLLLIVAIIFWRLKRKRQHGAEWHNPPNGSVKLEPTRKQFSYSEILRITNNRQRILGKGGFGTVYHGYMDDGTQVAIKLLSSSSNQGLEQFHAEVKLLLRVHHTNLTSLVGYCDDENNKGLVYEYMAGGNLQEYFSDKSSNVLTWEGRLQIATDAAQGLEYLHHGCKPPMIHRDVKTTNILLSENFQAKLSDFGLSRNFPEGDGTHIITCVAGTPGYLAPEYKQLNKFNEKSDVYSFGIVLLEIITGRRAISRTRERIPINEWVGSIIPTGDIDAIVDPRLNGIFNVSSAWKLVEIAMACVSPEANKRPTMSKIVGELKQCLETQLSQRNQSGYESEQGSSFEILPQNGYSINMLRPSVR